jgi:hypothetical protein
LDVGGDIKADNNLIIDGSAYLGHNVYVGQQLYVNTDGTDRGILSNYNTNSASEQLKYYTRTFEVHAVLGPHGSSPEFSINIAGSYSSPPACWVGNEVSTGGTVGELRRVIVYLYDMSTTSMHAKLINTDNASVDYYITYNLICIGN